MTPAEWTFRCAKQLHEQWPRVPHNDLEHLADALLKEERWSSMEPSQAALEWLRQGIPAPHQHVADANPWSRSG